MNKNKIVDKSSKKQPLKEYLAFLKSRSKQKSEMLEQKSKSPQSPHQGNLSPKSSQSTNDWLMLQKRYLELQEKYSGLLKTVKDRNNEYDTLKKEEQMYKRIHQNDCKQIARLRGSLGLAKKMSVQTQVDWLLLEISNPNTISRTNKFDQSTQDEIRMKQSWEKFNPKDAYLDLKIDKGMKLQSSQKTLLNNKHNYPLYSFKDINCKAVSKQQNEEQSQQTGRFHKKLSNSPYSKLKFIPKTNY